MHSKRYVVYKNPFDGYGIQDTYRAGYYYDRNSGTIVDSTHNVVTQYNRTGPQSYLYSFFYKEKESAEKVAARLNKENLVDVYYVSQ